jgi:Golgi phosphoprotein 3
MLNLMEELFLLSLCEKGEKGRVKFSDLDLRYGLAGAALAELSLKGKIEWDDKQRLRVIDTTASPDKLLNEFLLAVQSSKKPRSLAEWINVLGDTKKLRSRLIASLVAKKNLQEKADRYLWVIPTKVYAQVNASAKFQVKERLRGIVLAGQKPDEYAVALLSLVRACGLLEHVFTVDEIKLARKRVDTLVQAETIGATVTEVIETISAATTAAVLAAVAA